MCKLMHRLFCACFHQGGDDMATITNLVYEYQRAEEALVSKEQRNRWFQFSLMSLQYGFTLQVNLHPYNA